MDYQEALEVLERYNDFDYEHNSQVEAIKLAKEALTKSAFFENEVSEIHTWFVENKDCLSDSAMKVARKGFKEHSIYDKIDLVDLDSITGDIVEELWESVLRVLCTFMNSNKEVIPEKVSEPFDIDKFSQYIQECLFGLPFDRKIMMIRKELVMTSERNHLRPDEPNSEWVDVNEEGVGLKKIREMIETKYNLSRDDYYIHTRLEDNDENIYIDLPFLMSTLIFPYYEYGMKSIGGI